MRVVMSKTKVGFRIVEADEIFLDENGSITVLAKSGEEIKSAKHKSWTRGDVAEYLEGHASMSGPINLSQISRPHKDSTPF